LRVFFTDEITEGFKTSAPYGDVTDSPMEMLTDSPRDLKRQLCKVAWLIHRWNCWRNNRLIQNYSTIRWRALFADRLADNFTDGIIRRGSHWQKLIYPLPLDPILPYFSFFFLISTLPNCKQPAPPLKKNLPLLRTTSHISWSLLVIAFVFWFTNGFLSVFISNSIFLNFNI